MNGNFRKAKILQVVIDLKRKSIVETSSTWLTDIFDAVYFSCFAACISVYNTIAMYCFGLKI